MPNPVQLLHVSRLQGALEEIPALSKPGRVIDTAEFKQWRETVSQGLQALFDGTHPYAVRFAKLRFWSRRIRTRGDSVMWTPDDARIFRDDMTAAARIINEALEEFKITAESEHGAAASEPEPASSIRVFISHSSSDVAVVKLLIDLIRSALNLPAEEIRCTSIEGHRLEGGAGIEEALRTEIHQSEAFLGVLSPTSLLSTYVVFELGARWGVRKHLVPIVVPPVTPGDLKGPLSGLNAIDASKAAQLHQLVDNLAERLKVTPSKAAAFQHHIDEIRAYRAASGAPVPREPDRSPAQEAVEELPPEAKRILVSMASSLRPRVIRSRTLGGTTVQVDGEDLTAGEGPRGLAKLESALRQLQKMQLIQDVGHKGEIFELTAEGYDAADTLEAERARHLRPPGSKQ